MKLIIAFFKLMRWPNLVFIALTQWLFYFVVFHDIHSYNPLPFADFHSQSFLFYLLMLSSICIAGAGYIINDYFDLQIDAVNKPQKIVVDSVIKRRWVIMWHLILSFLGIVISAYISYKTHKWLILLANILCVILLWFYSTHLKKRLLIGNVLISALTAWVIVVVYFYCGATLINLKGWNQDAFAFNVKFFYKITFLYAGFAFVMSLIREVVKDMEDMTGDARYHCKTMPIEWGIPATKVYAGVWIVVCIGALSVVQLYAWQSRWWWSALYCITLIITPLIFTLQMLLKARVARDYHRISHLIKFIMLTGILSMLFFKFFL